jgi:hypothetical protein
MFVRSLYCIRRLGVVVPLCLVAGCWEVIEYQETAPVAVETRSESPPVAPEQAAQTEKSDPTEVEVVEAAPSPVERPQVEQPAVETTAAEGPAPAAPPAAADQGTSDVGSRYASAEVPAEAPTALAPPTDADFGPSTSFESDMTTSPPANEATTASAAVEDSKLPPAVSTRRAAWLLGSRLGLAALAHDRNVAKEETVIWLDEARTVAGQLGTTINELPPRPETDLGQPASREVLSYLLGEGKRIGGELAKNHGVDHASMFEVALKSNLLLVLNKPETAAVGHISMAIERAAPQAALPEELWRPLLDTLAQRSPPAAVRAAVRQMHAAVDAHLAANAEQ